MTAVELRDVRKSFGSVEVIHGIDLSIADGEFVALVGPSGCGKSTLLRMIAGLEDVTDGSVAFDGQDVTDLNPKQRNVAMVFQSYALYPHMNVEENIGFNLKIAGIPERDRLTRVAEAARMLNLSELLRRRPSQLSGGQRQRVAMGRAVVRNPAVFLFDEPLSNLDAKLRVQMRSEIKVLHRKLGTTAIYVTHDQIEAMTLADRIVVLDKGSIEQQGTPIELYRNPVNAFVAGFIGSPAMNFIDATVRLTAEGPVADVEGGQSVGLDETIAVEEGQPVMIGIRPEHFVSQGQQLVHGPVQLVEPTGAQTHVVFRYGGSDIVAVVDGSRPVRVGEDFRGAVERANVFIFDRTAGHTLSAVQST